MNTFTNTPNKDDGQTHDPEQKTSQTEPKTAISEALISLLDRARHMKIDLRSSNLTKSCPIITTPRGWDAAMMGGSIAAVVTSPFKSKKYPTGNRSQPSKLKARGVGAASTGRSVAVPPTTTTGTGGLRKLRKIESQLGQHVAGSTQAPPPPPPPPPPPSTLPPPPPPSPKSPLMTELRQAMEMADALKDEFKRNDVLTNRIVHQAMCINEELNLQRQHLRDMDLVEQIEMATESHGLNLLLANDELTEVKARCLKILDRSAISQETRILSQGTQTTSPLENNWSDLENAITQLRQFLADVSGPKLADVFKETETQGNLPKEALLQMTERIEELRHLMFTLKGEGPDCEMRLQKLLSESERNVSFHKVMASLESELIQVILLAPKAILTEEEQ